MNYVLRIDEQRRVELSGDVLRQIGVEIAKGDTRRVWGLIGASGQIQLLPPNSKLSKLRDMFDESVLRAEWDASGDAQTTTYRQLQAFLGITLRARTRGTNIRVT